MTGAIWAYSESERAANEVTSAANDLANASSAKALTVELGQARPGVSAGNRLVLESKSNIAKSPELAAEAIFRATKTGGPSVILIAATRRGREVASRLAAKLGAGCLSDVSRLSVSGNTLAGERDVYAGKLLAKVATTMPCVATVKVGAYPQFRGAGGPIESIEVGEIDPKVRWLRSTRKEADAVDLKSAKIIVSAGRGVKRKEDLAMIEETAKMLGGALGCSRPLSSDLGWLPEEHHIGLTGVSVRPDLYLAVGISGQLQHIAGIKDSRVIAAINTDRDAPIFQAADYGIVGDLYAVIPALQKALAARKA